MNSVQVYDGVGGPIEWHNPIRWANISNESRDYLTARAAHTDLVGVACRRLIYCFTLSDRGQKIDLGNITQVESDQLCMQYVLLDEADYAFKECAKQDPIFMVIAGYLGAMLSSAHITVDREKVIRQNPLLFTLDPIQSSSVTMTCEAMDVHRFRTPFTWVMAIKRLNHETLCNCINTISPFRLKSLVLQVKLRRIIFKDPLVLWIAQDRRDTGVQHICLRNVKSASQMTIKGSQEYKVTDASWSTYEQDAFNRNCEIGEKRFEQRYLKNPPDVMEKEHG